MGSDGYIIHIHHSSQQVKKRFRFVITIIYKSNLYITNECLYIATCSGLKKNKNYNFHPATTTAGSTFFETRDRRLGWMWGPKNRRKREISTWKCPAGSARAVRVIFLYTFFREIFFEIFFCEVCAGGIWYDMYMLDIFVYGQSGVVVLVFADAVEVVIDDCWCYMDCMGWSSLLFSAGRWRMMEGLYHSMPKQSLSIHSNIF